MISRLFLLWAATVALVLTFGGLYASVPRHRVGESSLMGVIAFAMSLLFWALFALNATQYVRLIGGGVIEQASTNGFMVVGLIGAILTFLLLLDATMRVLDIGL